MDEQDHIYLWMIIATFVALILGILFACLRPGAGAAADRTGYRRTHARHHEEEGDERGLGHASLGDRPRFDGLAFGLLHRRSQRGSLPRKWQAWIGEWQPTLRCWRWSWVPWDFVGGGSDALDP